MAKCDKCGNEYSRAFQISMNGKTNTFDSFECAISMLAPECSHCGCKIIGHGVEGEGKIYCCANCARHNNVEGLVDHK